MHQLGSYTLHFYQKSYIGIIPDAFASVLVFVIAWVAGKFGINTTRVVLEMGKISQGVATHYRES